MQNREIFNPETDLSKLAGWVAENWGVGDLKFEHLYSELMSVARNNPYDPFVEWVEALQADPDPDIYRRLCVEGLGSEPTEYNVAVLKKALIMTLMRQLNPGAKADYMPILEGPQGTGKTTFLRALFPTELASVCVTDLPPDWHSKDVYARMSSAVIVEVGELAAFRKKETADLKQFLTINEDRYRPPYGAADIISPRRAVCWGTTNESEYLKDVTGNRRFWPIRVRKIDLIWVRANIEKLWKTIHTDVKTGELPYFSPEEERRLCVPEQEERLEKGAIYDSLEFWLTQPINAKHLLPDEKGKQIVADEGQFPAEKPARWWRLEQLKTVLGLDPNSNHLQKELTSALRLRKWENVKMPINKKSERVWRVEGDNSPQLLLVK